MEIVGFRVTARAKRLLQAVAAARGRSLSKEVRRALKEELRWAAPELARELEACGTVERPEHDEDRDAGRDDP